MKGKIISIFLCFTLIFGIGIGVAYYNTRTYGFDEDAKVLSYDEEKISFLDYSIYYKDLNDIIDKAKKYVPNEHSTMCVFGI